MTLVEFLRKRDDIWTLLDVSDVEHKNGLLSLEWPHDRFPCQDGDVIGFRVPALEVLPLDDFSSGKHVASGSETDAPPVEPISSNQSGRGEG